MEEQGGFEVAVVSATADRVVVRVTGDLDMATADRFAEAIADVDDAARLIVDLTLCTFLDSAGVRALTAVLGDGRHVSLVTADPGIRRVLEITALDTRAEVCSTLDDAV